VDVAGGAPQIQGDDGLRGLDEPTLIVEESRTVSATMRTKSRSCEPSNESERASTRPNIGNKLPSAESRQKNQGYENSVGQFVEKNPARNEPSVNSSAK